MSVLRIRDVRLLVGAVGLSALGDLVLWIPLALRIREQTGSAFAVSALFLAMFGPIVVLAGVAGRVVDRVENRRLVIVVSLAQAVAVLALLTVHALGAVLALTALIGAGIALSAPAEFSLLPLAAGEERIAEANGHVESARYLGMTAGPLIGGALSAAGLFDVAVLVNAGSFLAVTAAAVALHTRRRPVRQAGAAPGDSGRARDGIAYLLRDRTLGAALIAAIAALVFFSVSMTAELFFVVDTLGAGQTGYGFLLTAWTAGMVAGALMLARRVPPARLAVMAVVAIGAQGAGLLLASLAGVLLVALGGFLLGGVAHGVKNVLLRTLIHERVPESLRGRAFAGYNAARNAAEIGALGLGGLLVGAVGARTALAVSGLVPLVLALVTLLFIATRRAAAGDPTTRRPLHAHVQG